MTDDGLSPDEQRAERNRRYNEAHPRCPSCARREGHSIHCGAKR